LTPFETSEPSAQRSESERQQILGEPEASQRPARGQPETSQRPASLSQRDSASESGVPSRFEAEPERLERLPAGQAAFLLRGDAKKRLQNKLPKKNQGTGSFTFFSAFFWRKNA